MQEVTESCDFQSTDNVWICRIAKINRVERVSPLKGDQIGARTDKPNPIEILVGFADFVGSRTVWQLPHSVELFVSSVDLQHIQVVIQAISTVVHILSSH